MSQPVTLRTESGDEDVDLAEFESRARRGEVSPQCLVRLPAVTGERFVPACELEIFRSLHEPKRAYFARAFSLARLPWVTAGLILLNVAVYVVTSRDGPLDLDGMVRYGGKVGSLITDLGELWRLLTANFVHRDALHIGLNMFVLLNVGAALENAYRRLDYVLLLVVSGICTMAASLLLSDAASVGASGMVYGCLGGVVVFGLKYRSILPSRYRRMLGEAAIPTVLVFLWIGWNSAGVDSAAHLGGLLAGLALSPFFRPRLLADAPNKAGDLFRALPSFAVVLSLFVAEAVVGPHLPLFDLERDDAFGISVPVPRGWRRGANRLGQLEYSNALPDLGRATFAAEAIESSEPADPAEQARRFIEATLKPAALGPDVSRVETKPLSLARVDGRDAVMVRAELEQSFGTTQLVAYFVPRGDWVYQLVFTYPAIFPRYARVLDRMVERLKFDEPRAMREARAAALLFPKSPWALARLGDTLRQLGEPSVAAQALEEAVKVEPSSVPFRAELARAYLQAADVERGCAAANDALLYGPKDPQALEATARCEVARGDTSGALAHIREARAMRPADERLRRAEAALLEATGRP